MAVIYRGVPLASAIIVRHTPNDHRPGEHRKNSGAIPVAQARKGLDYIGRRGEYESKGDIERACTRSDLRLAEDYASRAAEGHTLDYIARLGAFEGKGSSRQVDASLWNQYGPVDPRAAETEMARDGGAFVDSLITVKREHAQALGLTAKEDMQRLLRSTWTDNVMKWGLVKHASDVRWVAAYHTDADRSLHCHIFTWSARGEIAPGATVGRDGTRLGKEIVYSHGYASIRQERDRRACFLRDLSVLEVKRQLGLEVEPGRQRAIEGRARAGNWPERLSAAPELGPDEARKIEGLREKLASELELGHGRLSDNYRAQATVRDIVSRLEVASPSYARLTEECRLHAAAKAEIKGFSQVNDRHAYSEFVKSEMQDRLKRVCNAVVRAHVPPEPERPLRQDIAELDARGLPEMSNISFSVTLEAPRGLPGVGAEKDPKLLVRIPGRSPAEHVALPLRDTTPINGGKGRLALIALDRNYPVSGEDGAPLRMVEGKEVVARFGAADMDRIAKYNPAEPSPLQTEAERLRAERQLAARREAERRRERARKELERAREALDPAALRAQNDFSIRHGMPLSEAASLGRDASRLVESLRGSGAVSYEDLGRRDQILVDKIAEAANTKSSVIRGTLLQTAEHASARTGIPRERCFEMLEREAVKQTRDMVVERASAGSFRFSPERAGSRELGGMELASSVAELAETIIEGIRRTEAIQKKGSRARIHPRPIEPELERER